MESETQIASLKSELNALKDKFNCVQSERDRLDLERVKLKSRIDELERQNDRFISIIENLSKQTCK